jgi:hypothetical protein
LQDGSIAHNSDDKPDGSHPPQIPLVAKPDAPRRAATSSLADDFQVQHLTIPCGTFKIGEKIVFEYDLTNVSKKEATLPAAKINQNLVAARQHWIERVDGAEIPPLRNAFRQGNNCYRTNSLLLLADGAQPQRINPGGHSTYQDALSTASFPPGRYRLTVELQGKAHRLRGSTQELEFDLVDR